MERGKSVECSLEGRGEDVGRRRKAVLTWIVHRQQIFVEADAKMDTYETEDPNDRSKRVVRTQLNLLMREFGP